MQINLSVDLYDSLSSCARYVRYEGAMTAIGIEIVNLMMLVRLVLYVLLPQLSRLLLIVRVHALYRHKTRLIAVFVGLILLAETAVNVYLLTFAGRTWIPCISVDDKLINLTWPDTAVPHTEIQTLVRCECFDFTTHLVIYRLS